MQALTGSKVDIPVNLKFSIIFIIWRQIERVFLSATISKILFIAKNSVQTEWRKCQAVTTMVRLMQELAIIVPLGYVGLYVTVSSRHV